MQELASTPLRPKRNNLNDQVHSLLKEQLLRRQIGPGERLSLQRLATEFGVSRSPVNQALTRLVGEGLVKVDQRGYYVRPITVELMSNLHDVRCALELFAADRTVGSLTEEDLRSFRGLLEATTKTVEDDQFVDKPAYMLANNAFHEFIVDLTRNDVLSSNYRGLAVHRLMERALLESESAAGDSTREHENIYAAYEARDLASAREALIRNVETGKRLAVIAIERAGGVL